MKFTTTKADLLKIVVLAGTLEKKGTIPILGHIAIEAGAGKVKFTATDLDVTRIIQMDATVEETGGITVLGKKFIETVKALPAEGSVTIETDRDRVVMKAGGYKGKIAGEGVEKFPEIAKPAGTTFTMPLSALQEMITRTIFAVTTEESRYALAGIQVELGKGILRFVATNGHALAHNEVAIEDKSVEAKALVPKKAWDEVLKLDGANVKIVLGQQAAFAAGGEAVISKFIHGQFPNYERVLPNHTQYVEFETGKMLSAVDRVARMADERTHQIRLDIAQKLGESRISTDTDYGQASEELQFTAGETETTAIGLNAIYLVQIFKALKSDKARIYHNGNLVTVEIKEVSDDKIVKGRYVVMPMRL